MLISLLHILYVLHCCKTFCPLKVIDNFAFNHYKITSLFTIERKYFLKLKKREEIVVPQDYTFAF